MSLIKVRQNYQITIPNSVRKKFRIAVGDYVEMEKHDDGIVLKPVKIVRPDQAYFYTKEWQEGEIRADEEIATGDLIGPFDNVKDALTALKRSRI
jgi:AbrB family looped-hinge helix DNA binding protein